MIFVGKKLNVFIFKLCNYNPNTGRFISEDPIGFAGEDFNLYRYVENNSMKYIDPYGLVKKSNIGKLKDFYDQFKKADNIVEGAKEAAYCYLFPDKCSKQDADDLDDLDPIEKDIEDLDNKTFCPSGSFI
jgi:hypothetical protein